jgi:glycosyltransferase involved in cell wall biosynthesis
MNKKSSPIISVFTATFNRVGTLSRVFQSLQRQTFREFEWIIIDDGSTDKTDELVLEFKSTANFKIKYYWQINRGKHTAYNLFAKFASGEYYCSIDSDDEVPAKCLERLLYHFQSIPDNQKHLFAGVVSLAEDQDGMLIGDRFSDKELSDDFIKVLLNHKKLGDKPGLTRTQILRDFPFPEDADRTYVPESYHIHGYSKSYRTKLVNEILFIGWKEPRPDHLSDVLPSKENIRGTIYGLLAWPKYSMRFFLVRPRLYVAVTSKYISIAIRLRKGLCLQYLEIGNFKGRLLWFALLPLGLIRYVLDR